MRNGLRPNAIYRATLTPAELKEKYMGEECTGLELAACLGWQLEFIQESKKTLKKRLSDNTHIDFLADELTQLGEDFVLLGKLIQRASNRFGHELNKGIYSEIDTLLLRGIQDE